jgi:hypothetical protein
LKKNQAVTHLLSLKAFAFQFGFASLYEYHIYYTIENVQAVHIFYVRTVLSEAVTIDLNEKACAFKNV